MIRSLAEIIGNLISPFIDEPLRDKAIVLILTFFIVISVTVIGWLMDKIELLFYRLLARITKNPRLSVLICERITFPGVIVHELSHAALIWMTGGKVTKIKLLESGANGRLGHVEFYPRGSKLKRMLQLSLGSCAPVLVGMVVVTILIGLFFEIPGIKYRAIILYLIVSVIFHMSMSWEDLINYWHGVIVLFPLLYLGIYMIYR